MTALWQGSNGFNPRLYLAPKRSLLNDDRLFSARFKILEQSLPNKLVRRKYANLDFPQNQLSPGMATATPYQPEFENRVKQRTNFQAVMGKESP